MRHAIFIFVQSLGFAMSAAMSELFICTTY